jgi:hypothetical protein
VTGSRPEGRDVLAFSEILWPDPRRGPWYVRALWVEVGGRPEPAGVVVWHGAKQDPQNMLGWLPLPGTSPAPIRAGDIRSRLPWRDLLGTLREKAAKHEQGYRDQIAAIAADPGRPEMRKWFLDELASAEELKFAPVTEPKRIGRPPLYGPEHFAQVADKYREAWAKGDAPTQAVADAFTVERSTAAKWVARARGMGLLGEARPGRPGFAPAPRRRKKR